MPATGLRGFIELLDSKGLLERVTKNVSWKYEIGDIVRDRRTPVLFETIDGYPGARLFSNGLVCTPSLALAVGLDKRAGPREISRHVLKAFTNPLPPVRSRQAPVKENVVTGTDVDLETLPLPWWNRADGSRYVATWHLNVSNNPETGERNIGVYRMMLVSRTSATISFSPRSHLAVHVRKAAELGRPLEMAVAIGVDERLMVPAAAAPPYGVDEYGLAGGLLDRPVELTPCTTIATEVPADAEIVLEGVIDPVGAVTDGPYMDYAGVPNTNTHGRLFRVSAIMFRTNPIFRGTTVGRPGAEDHRLYSLLSRIGYTDFHGSRLRHRAQTLLLRHERYRLFQMMGRVRRTLASREMG
jgi:UbiD family decarboxylase